MLPLTIPALVAAQEDLPTTLSLHAAQKLARIEAPEVVLSTARASTARTEIGVAGMFPNPQLVVGSTSGSARIYGTFYIALPIFGQRAAAMDAADAQARVAAAGVEVTRLDARLAATLAWLDLWQLQEEFLIATNNALRRDRILDTAQARFAEGAAPRLEVLRAETDARRTRSVVASLEKQRSAAAARLSVLLSRNETLTVAIEGEPGTPYSPPSTAALESFIADHPLTQRAKAILHAAHAVVIREHRARRPNLGIQVGGVFSDRAGPPTHDAQASLKVDLPFFNHSLIARAESAQSTARTELETVVIQLRARMVSALSDYLAAVRRQEAEVSQVLPAAREAADLSDEAYQSGGLDLTGVLAAEQALSDARLAAVRSTADRARALGVLEHAAGRSL
jgi:outer membrane protein TolC